MPSTTPGPVAFGLPPPVQTSQTPSSSSFNEDQIRLQIRNEMEKRIRAEVKQQVIAELQEKLRQEVVGNYGI